MGEKLAKNLSVLNTDARATSQTRFWKQTRREVKEELVRQQQANEAKSKGMAAPRPIIAEKTELAPQLQLEGP